jgi:hypothetical protein
MEVADYSLRPRIEIPRDLPHKDILWFFPYSGWTGIGVEDVRKQGFRRTAYKAVRIGRRSNGAVTAFESVERTGWFIHRSLSANWQSIYNAPTSSRGYSSPFISGPRTAYDINSDFYEFDLLRDYRRDVHKLRMTQIVTSVSLTYSGTINGPHN